MHTFTLQILAGICAAAAVDGVTPGPLRVATTLGRNVSVVQGLFLEMFLTALLLLAIFILAVEKRKATFVAPLGIGAALFVAHLFGVNLTGASLNPARSFGPEVISGDFPGYAWIYWVGPFLGSLLAGGIYHVLKFLNYTLVSPTTDFDDAEMRAYEGTSFRHHLLQTNRRIQRLTRAAGGGERRPIHHSPEPRPHEAGPSTVKTSPAS